MEGIMAGVRQISELYLRGSLANITMANLTFEQRKHIEALFDFVANHPEMMKHKHKAIQKYGSTIAGDYKDDRAAAEAEYNIAIYKGLVDLFYHRKYEFHCGACESNTYLTKRNKPKSIDRIQKPCPNCNKVLVTNAGNTDLQEGKYVTIAEFLDSYKDLQSGFPECISSITYKALEPRYSNADEIIKDPKQLKKFFGEFVWNYFRQHISENQKKKSKKSNTKIHEKADIVFSLKLLNICDNYKIKYTTNYDINHFADIDISFKTNLVQPECTIELAETVYRAKQSGINVVLTDDKIIIQRNYEADYASEVVAVSENVQLQEPDENQDNFNNYSKVSRGGIFMDVENHVETIEMIDVISNIRDSLPEGTCQQVFDIKNQSGEIYKQFSETYGDSDPKAKQIADFLNISPRLVTTHINNIKIMCLAKGLNP